MIEDTPVTIIADETTAAARAPGAVLPTATKVAKGNSGGALSTAEQPLDHSEYAVGPSSARRELVVLTLRALAASAGAGLVSSQAQAQAPTDSDIVNFLLNLEYLAAEFYSRAAFGTGLPQTAVAGVGTQGAVTGGRKVMFVDSIVSAYAREIAQDHVAHVNFLRNTLGPLAIAEPGIDFSNSFTSLAVACGLIVPGQTFDPFADDVSFQLGAYFFNDILVTAYQGALLLIASTNTPYIAAVAGILAVEAYHAAIIRTQISIIGGGLAAGLFSNLRATLSGKPDDVGILVVGGEAVIPVAQNGTTYSRTPGQVLNILYGARNARAGLFFPNGVNGAINTGETPTS